MKAGVEKIAYVCIYTQKISVRTVTLLFSYTEKFPSYLATVWGSLIESQIFSASCSVTYIFFSHILCVFQMLFELPYVYLRFICPNK